MYLIVYSYIDKSYIFLPYEINTDIPSLFFGKREINDDFYFNSKKINPLFKKFLIEQDLNDIKHHDELLDVKEELLELREKTDKFIEDKIANGFLRGHKEFFSESENE